jgi:hypothetical protein
VTSSPCLYVLFRTAVPGILPVTRLPFGVCAVAGWCGACHLTIPNMDKNTGCDFPTPLASGDEHAFSKRDVLSDVDCLEFHSTMNSIHVALSPVSTTALVHILTCVRVRPCATMTALRLKVYILPDSIRNDNFIHCFLTIYSFIRSDNDWII